MPFGAVISAVYFAGVGCLIECNYDVTCAIHMVMSCLPYRNFFKLCPENRHRIISYGLECRYPSFLDFGSFLSLSRMSAVGRLFDLLFDFLQPLENLVKICV